MQSHQFVSFKGGILLANLFQSSRSTFSWGSFLSFFVFKAGMLDTHISALGGWPTVSGGFVRQLYRTKKPRDTPVMTPCIWCEPARGGAGGVYMPIAPRAAAEQQFPANHKRQ